MANLRNRGSKSDLKMSKQQCAPYLEDALSKFEERRGDLTNRQQYLTEKITTMERCIPALMAFNMWTSGRNCEDPPMCKVRQIMNKLSPNSDPTEKLVEKLKSTVKSLNTETAELHEKIIEADVALEESGMELDSIVLANEEFEGKLKSLEKELKINETPSLHSINSEDLFCLTKIRQLGEEQVNLKNSIRVLEERELMFHEQMNRLLTSKEFRKVSCDDGTNKKIRELECSERRMHCALHEQKYNVLQLKKKLTGKAKELVVTDDSTKPSTSAKDKSEEKPIPAKSPDPRSTVALSRNNVERGKKLSRRLGSENSEYDFLKTCTCPTSASMACYDKSSCPKTSTPRKSQSSRNALAFCNTCMGTYSRHPQHSQWPGCSPKSCGLPLVSKSSLSRGQICASCCKFSAILANSSSMNSTSWKGDRQSEISRTSKAEYNSRHQTPPLSEIDSPCRKCQVFPPCKECLEPRVSTSCRCSCKGKCALGESDVPCNCAEYLNSADDEGYQPSGDSTKINDQSSTDEEYCECCDCGCEDSDDLSDSCQC